MPASQNPRQIGMRDIAAQAGVSVITVSRVLRTPSLVSEETRNRVLSVIKDLGYVSNGVAASLSSQRSNIVAALIPNIRNALHAAMMQGLSEVLHQAGIHLMVTTVDLSMAREEEVLAACLRQRPCAIVLHHTRHTANTLAMLKRASVPVVEVGDLLARPVQSVVSYSNHAAGHALTMSLIQQGRRKIAIAYIGISGHAEKRVQGYEAALREAKLPILRRHHFECASGHDHGAEAIVRILETAPDVDAVIFSSLASAVGAWFECERRGWSAARIGIASFDDPELTGWRGPKLTVVRLPRYEVGQEAARIILRQLADNKRTRVRVDLGFEVRSY